MQVIAWPQEAGSVQEPTPAGTLPELVATSVTKCLCGFEEVPGTKLLCSLTLKGKVGLHLGTCKRSPSV